MHDFFDVLGLSNNAPVSEIRRACARRGRRSHPDFGGGVRPASDPLLGSRVEPVPVAADVAIDFVDVGVLLDRIQTDFFGRDR